MRSSTPLTLLLLAACPTDSDTDATSTSTGAATDVSTDAPPTTTTASTGAATTSGTTDATTTTPTTSDTSDTSDTGATTSAATGSTGEHAMFPGDVLDLRDWKLTLPVDTDHPGTPDEIEQPELATFVDPVHFHLNDALDGVVFRAHAGGVTTSGSGYPRSELREMTDGGAEEAAWSSSVGTHRMVIDQRVTHLPVEKPHIVVGQIHDDEDDVIVFRLEGSKLFIDLNGDDGPVLDPDYVLGERFTVAFEVSGDHVDCYYNDALVYTHEQAFDGAYFKAGAYVQSSCMGAKQVPDEACDAHGEVEIHGLQVAHE